MFHGCLRQTTGREAVWVERPDSQPEFHCQEDSRARVGQRRHGKRSQGIAQAHEWKKAPLQEQESGVNRNRDAPVFEPPNAPLTDRRLNGRQTMAITKLTRSPRSAQL